MSAFCPLPLLGECNKVLFEQMVLLNRDFFHEIVSCSSNYYFHSDFSDFSASFLRCQGPPE